MTGFQDFGCNLLIHEFEIQIVFSHKQAYTKESAVQ